MAIETTAFLKTSMDCVQEMVSLALEERPVHSIHTVLTALMDLAIISGSFSYLVIGV